MKKISLDDSIYKTVEANPEMKEILVNLGFEHLNDNKMYMTMAKMVTLRKAMRMHNISYDTVQESLKPFGFELLEEEL